MELVTILKLVHLSDLHFGTQSEEIVSALEKTIQEINPDFVVISGDFTQIGSVKEFQIAQSFLKNFSCPYLCVPGNHDIPARHIMERFFSPYRRYRDFIAPDLCPSFENDQVVIAGLNSARAALPHWNWANGAISGAQRKRLAKLYDREETRWTICTFHHPIHKVDEMPLDVTVFGRKRTLQAIQDSKIDIVLTGHVHYASVTTRGDGDHQTVYVSASTALSSRTRGQENGFNLITLDDDKMSIEIFKLADSNFSVVQSFERMKSH